jgi:hypothetical protein
MEAPRPGFVIPSPQAKNLGTLDSRFLRAEMLNEVKHDTGVG